jgi:hypothetical protein
VKGSAGSCSGRRLQPRWFGGGNPRASAARSGARSVFARHCGQTSALKVGIERARAADRHADADLQNDPADIKKPWLG